MMPQARSLPASRTFVEKAATHFTVFPREQAVKMISPALQSASGPELPAYEMKFIVSEEQAREIEARSRVALAIDAHDRSVAGHGYQITTLYTDNDLFDVFYHEPPFRRHKYRLRRYGMESHVFLERRSRWHDRVKKQRNAISVQELALFAEEEPDADWAGGWFHDCLREGNLHPVCRVTYRRAAYSGSNHEGSMRLTFDRAICGCLTKDWIVEPFADGVSFLEGLVLCEIKFCSAMPLVFKQVVQDLRLEPTRISKYRAFMRMSGRLSDKRSIHV